MRQGVTFDEISELISARCWLIHIQLWLWRARVTGQQVWLIRELEATVGKALDRVWEAQQRAA